MEIDTNITAEDMQAEVEQLYSQSMEVTPHAEILSELLNQLEPLDFEVLAFPQAEKLKQRLEELEADKESWGSKESTGIENNPKQTERLQLTKFLEKLKLKLKHYLVL